MGEILPKFLFFDRIEIITTGGLPVELNKEEFYRGISKLQTKKIFGQLGYAEQMGAGLKQAFDIMEVVLKNGRE